MRTIILMCVQILLGIQAATSQSSVRVVPESVVVTPGTGFSIQFRVGDVTQLHLSHISLEFDSRILRYAGANPGSFLPGDAFFYCTSPGAGVSSVLLDAALLGSGSARSGSGVLYTLQFIGSDTGLTSLKCRDVELRDTSNETIPCGVTEAWVRVKEPEPVTLLSFSGVHRPEGGVELRWCSGSEEHNYGFQVQRAQSIPGSFEDIGRGFVPGRGTSMGPGEYHFIDSTVSQGEWHYRLCQLDLDGWKYMSDTIRVHVPDAVPERNTAARFFLEQNFPNPFNGATTIRYGLPGRTAVSLAVYSILGQRVAVLVDGIQEPGTHEVVFSADWVSSGVYVLHLIAGNPALGAAKVHSESSWEYGVRTRIVVILK